MAHKDNNLTKFFTEYLTQCSKNKAALNATNIIVACSSALGEVDASLNLTDVIFDMRNDFEYIYKILDDYARYMKKNSHGTEEQRKSTTDSECLTIPEIHRIYGISQQAIRKACNKGRIRPTEGQGKNKYLISKAEIENYMSRSKYKSNNRRA